MKIQVKILNKKFYKDGVLPKYATDGSAAIDLITTESVTFSPESIVKIHTGLALWLGGHDDTQMRYFRPHWGYAALIIPRSGLGTKGIVLANTVGLIDEDYQGELLIQAWNRNNNPISISEGDRIAQLMIVPVAKTEWEIVDEFSAPTKRGSGCFGHSGV